jgi:hypothetical protein
MGANDKADTEPDPTAARIQGVLDENRHVANRTMPGGRAALRPGPVRPKLTTPQADENRDQPVAADGSLRPPDKPPLTD